MLDLLHHHMFQAGRRDSIRHSTKFMSNRAERLHQGQKHLEHQESVNKLLQLITVTRLDDSGEVDTTVVTIIPRTVNVFYNCLIKMMLISEHDLTQPWWSHYYPVCKVSNNETEGKGRKSRESAGILKLISPPF